MMIFILEYGEFKNITFTELRERFPNTSFCVPLKQTALPDNVILARNSINDLGDVFEFEKNKKTVPSQPYKKDGEWVFRWEIKEAPEEELEAQMDKVDNEVSKLMVKIQWAFSDDISDRLKSKYTEIKKQILAVYEQDGYPFHVKYPEVE